jgi:DNA repair protein RadA/Sms
MPKTRTKFVCQNCGLESPAMYGRCPECGAWNSMVETLEAPTARKESIVRGRGAALSVVALDSVESAEENRHVIPISELNRVLGGGLVPGSLVLVGGDPGIGKSTLLLQAASMLAQAEPPVLYVSAEESAQQVKLRADRLGLGTNGLFVLSETRLDDVLAAVEQLNPSLLIVDSIQTVYLDELTSAAGSVSQVRECTSRIMQFAKPRQLPVFLVGHVTKEGAIAGPRVLEHMVDAVVYLEGDRFHQFRILRAVKNRFGSTDEVGVFEMADAGMREVRNPSEVFLQERSGNAAGSAIAVTLEGSRPILLEVQALTANSALGMPRRTANGFDGNRVQMLVAVLTKRVGLPLSGQDIYVNIVGGLRVVEPAVDLAVVVAMASSFRERPVDRRSVVIGEVGLSGELRSVNQLERRIAEAQRLGFERAIVPASPRGISQSTMNDMEITRVATVSEAIEAALGGRE